MPYIVKRLLLPTPVNGSLRITFRDIVVVTEAVRWYVFRCLKRDRVSYGPASYFKEIQKKKRKK